MIPSQHFIPRTITYVRHHFTRSDHFNGAWGITHLAAQQELGLLSQRRSRFGVGDSNRAVVAGENLSAHSLSKNIMTRSIKELYGHKLNATDHADIGHVKDFYFDDQSWAVRYLVVDTGTWLASRQVLLSPHAIGSLQQPGKVLTVNLTKKQIEDSPPIEWHKPVSRQYEEEYYQYYGWPYYWQGDGLWGMSGFPILDSKGKKLPTEQSITADHHHKPADTHLRSAQAVKGYRIQASDGIVGHVADFILDDERWAITQLIIKIGHRLSGSEVAIQTGDITRISYDESTVFVKLTIAEVQQSEAYDHTAPVSLVNPTKNLPL